MNKLVTYILIFIIIVALGAIGFFIYKSQQNKAGIGPASLAGGPAAMVEPQSQEESEVVPQEKEAILSDLQVGDPNAPVTIVEYFGYFCGYCVKFHSETFPQIKEKYIDTGKVRFIIRPFPPLELGIAVLCAREQDKFLEYHDYLFENAGKIEKADDLVEFARDIGLDDTKFVECYNSEKYLAKAQEWHEQGGEDFEKAGVPPEKQGTPAFFINDELLFGAHPFENFAKMIEEKLGE